MLGNTWWRRSQIPQSSTLMQITPMAMEREALQACVLKSESAKMGYGQSLDGSEDELNVGDQEVGDCNDQDGNRHEEQFLHMEGPSKKTALLGKTYLGGQGLGVGRSEPLPPFPMRLDPAGKSATPSPQHQRYASAAGYNKEGGGAASCTNLAAALGEAAAAWTGGVYLSHQIEIEKTKWEAEHAAPTSAHEMKIKTERMALPQTALEKGMSPEDVKEF
ncbi:hypothetical protein BDK51DRAFT_44123 [Blyttiomyces helicus]|uniref:Uncharacterized protein n=1 Tax=Blyttiomyces helicus TaxID=388810 RepID=A0A4P9WKL1_9FUNG|nr:hypothetical protein BDK51DRAFT_44123 [Blyttiomyces helicus]|eukprot:RKO92553.1 hypothetical protein BDK51DRAFT_44123 [Blyttiomyces helicus]